MNVCRKHVESLGFKGNGMYPYSQYHTHFYQEDAKAHTITVIGNLVPQTISHFHLTPSQFTDFQDGKLSLIPNGCCNPAGGRSLERSEILFRGDIKNLRHLKKILDVL